MTEDFLSSQDLTLINEPSPLTTHLSPRLESNIDSTLVSGAIAPHWITGWRYEDRVDWNLHEPLRGGTPLEVDQQTTLVRFKLKMGQLKEVRLPAGWSLFGIVAHP